MSRSRGFTLLEVLVATAILGVTIVALMGTQSGAIRLAGAHHEQSLSAQFAQHLLAEAMITPYEDLAEATGEGEGIYAGYRWRRTLSPAGAERLSRVTIVITDANDTEIVTVETLVTARGVDL